MSEINDFLSKNAIKQLNYYQKSIDRLEKSYANISKAADALEKEQSQGAKTQQQLTTRQKEALKLQKSLRTTIAKREQAESKLNKELIKQKAALQEQTRALKEQAKQDAGIKKRNGLFKSMTKSIVAATTAMFGLMAIFKVLKDAGKLVREFQKENAVLAGILGKTRDEISELTKDAEKLGSITAVTAKQVTSLQISYARLGFTQEEILNLTKDTIDGSIALNAELSETAELTGAMVRSFDDLKTTDADLILDQLTLSTQKTALNFEKLQTALPIVAGAAAAAGVEFKTVVAQLGQAADRGIDASTSATSLRNIYIELAAKGLTLEQALKKINTSQDKLSTATDLFGKRAAVTALSLADTTEKTKELESALDDAGGTAEKVAREQLDTLDGSIKLLTSAWEGFILSIESGEGAIANLVTGSLKKFADILVVLSNLDLVFTRNAKLTAEEITRTYDVLTALNNKTGRNFRKFVDEYDDVSSQWLAINKNNAVEFLKELGFSNRESELLYTEHLRRLVNEEITAAKASQEVLKDKVKDEGRALQSLTKLESKQSELNEAYKKAIEVYGADLVNEFYLKGLKNQEEYTNRGLTIDQEYLDEKVAKNQEAFDKLKEQELEYNETRKEILNSYKEIATDTINSIYDFQLNAIDNEIEQTANLYAIKIAAAEQNGTDTFELEQQYEAKSQELERQRAEKEKQQALINVGITYAQTAFEIIAQALALATVNPALSALAWGNLGLLTVASGVQAAAISQFDEGTGSTPSTYIAGEKRPEFRQHNGQWELLTQPTLFNNSAGDTIISGSETEHILKGASMQATTGNAALDTNRIVRAIETNKSTISLDKRGYVTEQDKNGNRRKWLDQKIRN